jgi:hypothetical protein
MKVAMVAKGALLLSLVCNVAIAGKFLTAPSEICVQWRCQNMYVEMIRGCSVPSLFVSSRLLFLSLFWGLSPTHCDPVPCLCFVHSFGCCRQMLTTKQSKRIREQGHQG